MAVRIAQVGGEAGHIGLSEAKSALSWWLDAGVDVAVQEQPRNWLKPAVPRRELSSELEPVTNVSQPSHETLAELQQWLANSVQLPFAGSSPKRVLPHGLENAPVMLLADAPALEDAVAGRPIGGDAWILAVRMLAAIGIAADRAYSASLSCVHAPGARMSENERRACADLARQQIRLAKPQRILLFGDGPCMALLDKRLVQARGHVHKIEGVRTVATFHPRHLINRPLDKSLAWRDLLLLMEDEP